MPDNDFEREDTSVEEFDTSDSTDPLSRIPEKKSDCSKAYHRILELLNVQAERLSEYGSILRNHSRVLTHHSEILHKISSNLELIRKDQINQGKRVGVIESDVGSIEDNVRSLDCRRNPTPADFCVKVATPSK